MHIESGATESNAPSNGNMRTSQPLKSAPYQPVGGNSALRRAAPAFTLVEMLIVMGIIGILVALLYPTIRSARLAAERNEAARSVAAIEAAMNAYQNEYGRFPLQTSGSADREYTGADYISLWRILRGLTAQWNPKGLPFMDLPDKALSSDGRFLDPWDEEFRIFADFNNDRQISAGVYGTIFGRSVVVWSKGPDRLDTTPTNRADDVRSWGG